MFRNDKSKEGLLFRNNLSEVWCISHKTGKKSRVNLYNVTRFFKKLILEVSEKDLFKIPTYDEPETGKNLVLRKRFAGRLLKIKNDIWYIDTEKYKRWKIDPSKLMDMLMAFSEEKTDEELNKIPTDNTSHVKK